MRLMLPLLSSLTLFCACNHYQYITISSPNLPLNDKKDFVAENDTMRMEYSFNGANVSFSFENKLDAPIFIDWQRSALLIDKTSYSYMPARGAIQADVNRLSAPTGDANAITTHTITGSIASPETMEFVAPHTRVFKNPMQLPGHNIKLPDSVGHREAIVAGAKTRYVQVVNFTEDHSPLRFRSYVTYRVGEPTAPAVVFEHDFYVSEWMSTKLNTLYFQDRKGDGNRYHTVSSSGAAGAVIGTLILGGIMAAAIASGGHSSQTE